MSSTRRGHYLRQMPIGVRLDPVSRFDTLGGDGAVGIDPPQRTKAVDRRCPLPFIPSPCDLGDSHREPAGADLQHQAFARPDLVGDEQGDVYVAAPLAHHRQLLPQRDQRVVGQRHRRVGRGQRLARHVQSGDDRVDQCTRLGNLIGGQIDANAFECPAHDLEPRRLE